MGRTMILRRPANRRKTAADGHSPLLRAGVGLAVVVLAAGAFVAGGYAIWRGVSESPHFNVQQVIVLHNRRASADEVTALLGIEPGQNLFKLDLESLKSDVELHPWVASARVYRRLPSTLVADVVEHVPAAVLQSGGLYYVSDDGVVFKAIRPEESVDYPVITGIDITAVRAGDTRSLGVLRDLVAFLQMVAHGGMPSVDDLDELNWDAEKGLTVYSAARIPVVQLGTAGWDIRWKQLQAILLDIEERQLDVSTVDFRSQRMAVLRMQPVPHPPKSAQRRGAQPDAGAGRPGSAPGVTPGTAPSPDGGGAGKSLEI